MRLLKPVLCAVLLWPGFGHANELMRVFELAVQNDATFQASTFARDAAREAKAISRGALLPQISGTANIAEDRFTLHDYDVDPVDPDGAAGPLLDPGGPPEACAAQGGDFSGSDCTVNSQPYNLTVQLNQVLFDWGLWSRLAQSSDLVAAAEITYRAEQQNLALRTATAYFNFLAAADAVRTANAAKQAVERQLDLAKKRFEVGLAAITDQQEAQARYDLSAADLITAEQSLASAREALGVITGSTEVRQAPLREDIPLVGPVPDNVGDWLRATEEGSFEVAGSRLQAEIAEGEVDIVRTRHYPTLGVNATGTEAKSSGFNQGKFGDNRVTLQLNVPIFSGFSTQAAVRQARSTHSQRVAELERARRTAQQNTRNAYQGVIAGVARVKALKQAVVSNQTALQASEVGLEVGARTNIDVLNAQQLLFLAERDYSRARYDYLLSILRLKAGAGQLGAKDLAEIDQLLEIPAGG
ncbi:MAG TPA: TolC family outer membrane protein [Candidatus Binatia bacterium]|nr:TolC family outer membrane protein [Candidatus Binatia bacterium]